MKRLPQPAPPMAREENASPAEQAPSATGREQEGTGAQRCLSSRRALMGLAACCAVTLGAIGMLVYVAFMTDAFRPSSISSSASDGSNNNASSTDETTLDDPTTPPTEFTPSLTISYGMQESCQKNDNSAFNICLDLRSSDGQYHPWMDAFEWAAHRWEEVIVGDNLPPVVFNWEQSDGTKDILVIDDLFIAATDLEIDGLGGTIGIAAPFEADVVGDDKKLIPRGGWMEFDSADIASAMADGQWRDTILHEMGHVLGIGLVWKNNELHFGGDTYLGEAAQSQWTELGCSGGLPVEKDELGGATANVHWDEACLGTELMTGISQSQEEMKLSKITIGTLEDIGYVVNYEAADDYTKEDLGICDSFCPEAGVNRVRGRRRNQGNKPKRPELSSEQRQSVDTAAASMFSRIQSSKLSRADGDSIEPEEVIVYRQYPDGNVYGYPVTRTEVMALLSHP